MKKTPSVFYVCLLVLVLAGCDAQTMTKGFDFGFARKEPQLDLERIIPTPAGQPAGSMHVIKCKASNGTAKFKAGWYDFDPSEFTIAQGAVTQTPFVRKNIRSEEMLLQARYEITGQKLVFCPVRDAKPGEKIACASIFALEDDFTVGIKRTFDVQDAIRGGELFCKYKK